MCVPSSGQKASSLVLPLCGSHWQGIRILGKQAVDLVERIGLEAFCNCSVQSSMRMNSANCPCRGDHRGECRRYPHHQHHRRLANHDVDVDEDEDDDKRCGNRVRIRSGSVFRLEND